MKIDFINNRLLFSFTFFLIFLFLPTYLYPQFSEQKYLYQDLIAENSIDSEQIWALAILYHSSGAEQKKELKKSIREDRFFEALDSSSTRNSLLNLSRTYNNEYLLLAYLLNDPDPENRNQIFEDFYGNNKAPTKLFTINQSVKNENIVELDLQNSDYSPFLLFLLTQYNQILKVINETTYSEIEIFKNEIYPTLNLNQLLDELVNAAFFHTYYNINEFNKIEEIYPRLIEIKFFPASVSKRNIFWSLDYVMYQLGHIDKSLEVQREFTIPLTEYLRDFDGLHSIYSSHGGYLYMIGKYQEARNVFQDALEWADRLDDQNLTKLYNNLSLVYFKTGESGKYVETQLQALDHAQSYENYDYQISIHRNLHIFYRKNQNYDLANQYIDRAVALAEEIENREDLISILISKSVFESSHIGNSEQADEYLKKAERLIDDDTSSRYVIRVLSERAKLLKEMNKNSESLNIQNKIVELGRSQSDPSIYLEALTEVADLEFKLGNYEKASDLLREFRAHDISVVDFSVLSLSKMLEAGLLYQNGDYREANQLFAETTDLVLERARYSADHESGYWTVESEYLQIFEAYADFLINRQRYDEAVQLLDRVKTINDASMLQNPLITSTQLTEEQLTRDRQITQEMEQLRRKVFNATGDERLQLNNRLERLQAQKREIHQHRRSFSNNEQTSVPIRSVQRSMKRGQILFHVTDINSNYYLSKVTRNSVNIEKLEVDEEKKALFETAIETMATGRPDLEKLYEIGQVIGIDQIPVSTKSIVMMPDGYLHQLPLDVIPTTKPDNRFSYGSTSFLIEEIDVRHLNHLGELFNRSRGSGSYQNDFSGFGVADFHNEQTGRNLMSLPKAPGEIQSISNNLNRFTAKSSIINENATPRKFKESVANSRILHMATHSEISESDPLFSRLHLVPESDSSEATNQVFAYELFELDLQNELIMLNSCESGGDRVIQGSGIMGISRALNYAGAQSLVLNAWSVNDQFAADFAETFYGYINDGESKSRALQLTKIDFIKTKNANPHYWGPYILNGDNQPLIHKRGTTAGNWIVAAAFIFGFIFVTKNRQAA